MSDTRPAPPVPSGPDEVSHKKPRFSRRRYLRHLFLGVAGLAVLLIVGVVGLYFWASSSSFENIVRKRLIARIEEATGGRAEIGSFHWDLLKLECEADNVVLHGREAAGEKPYAQAESLRVAVNVLGLLSPRVLLRNFVLERPQIHLIVNRDGSTNQPHPRTKTDTHVLDTLFDLQAGHVEVNHGVIDYDERSDEIDFQDRHIPVDFAANDVSLLLEYVPGSGYKQESYHLESSLRDLRMVRGPADHPDAPPVEGHIQAVVDFTRNAAYLRSLQLTAHSKGSTDRVLNVSGELDDFSRPHWKTAVRGELDLKLMEPALGYPFTPEGIARLDLAAAGVDGEFRIDGTVHTDNASYIGTGVVARGVGLDARVHADPLHLQITNVTARLKQGGQLEGEVLLEHWIAPLAGAPVVEVAEPAKREKKGKSHEKALPVVTAKVDTDLHTNGKVIANLRGVTLDTMLSMVSEPPFERLGLNALLNGLSTAAWTNGDVNTLAVSTNLKLSPPQRSVPGEAQTNGAIEATYHQRNGSVDLRNLQVDMPSSQITAHGQLGAFPMTSPSALAIEVHSANLDDFDKLFRDFGITHEGKSGVSALPIALDGQADFKGTWTGSLEDPHLAGELQATNLSAEMPTNKAAPPRLLHWDSVDATGSYSATRITIEHGQLRHGDAEIIVDGTLTAATSPSALSPGMPAFDSNSVLRAHLKATAVNPDNLAPLFGEKLPVTGLLSAQVLVDGPIQTLNGSGWIQLDNGTLYGEPLTRVHAQGKTVGQALKLSSVTMNSAAGTITGSGTYDMHSRQFQVDAHGSGIDVGKIERLRKAGAELAGSLGFSLSGSGTFDDPHLNSRLALAGFTVSGEHFGEFDIVAHTANRNLIYDITSRLEAAELTAHGQTALSGDNETQATLKFSKFNIGALLESAHINELTGESDLEGTVNLAGPLAHPEQMHGEARIQQLAVTIAGVHLQSEGGLHATMGNSQITLDPLHVTGEDTNVQVHGTLNLTGKRQLDVAANGSINLKLAETVDPDLTAQRHDDFPG